jgi:hypothetical protein
MNADVRPRYRRQRRGAGVRDGTGQGRGRRQGADRWDDRSLSARTATRALVAVGAYVAQDLRDPDGVTRPMLRRAALRMVASRQAPIRRLGSAYLRSDPPAPEELPQGRPVIETRQLLPGDPATEPDRESSGPPEATMV